MKLLTISVAAYNVASYLAKTLQSMAEPGKSGALEVLVVDDGSTDGTREVAMAFVSADPGTFKYIPKENGGYGSTINTAVRHASGRYFKTVDGDDWVDSAGLSRLLERLRVCEADIVMTDYMACVEGKNPEPVHNFPQLESGQIYPVGDERIYACQFSMHNMTVRTELLRGGQVRITEKCFYTDTEYMLKSLIRAKTVCYEDLMIYQYRLGRTGQSVSLPSYQKNISQLLTVYRHMLDEIIEWQKTGPDPGHEKGVCWLFRKAQIEPCFSILLSLPKPADSLRDFDRQLREKSDKLYEEAGRRPLIRMIRSTDYRSAGVLRHAYLMYRKTVG